MQPLVYILHEIVKVYAGLRRDVVRQGIIKDVHEHCLATPNVTVHVKALWQVRGYLG